MFSFKPTQKFRVIIGPVSLFTTARTIRMGIGDSYKSNAAAQKALHALEHQRTGETNGMKSVGLAGNWEGLNVQLDEAAF